MVEEAGVPERTIDHVQATGRFYDLRLRVKYILFVINKAGAYIFQNRIGGVMFRASGVVDRGSNQRVFASMLSRQH